MRRLTILGAFSFSNLATAFLPNLNPLDLVLAFGEEVTLQLFEGIGGDVLV